MAIYRESCSIDPNSKDFLVGDFSFNQQYCRLYQKRLAIMKKYFGPVVKAKWGLDESECNQHSIVDIDNSRTCSVVGIIYKDMVLQKSLLEKIQSTAQVDVVSSHEPGKFVSDTDTLYLEDESGRIKLIPTTNISSELETSKFLTGMIICVLGSINNNIFICKDYCFPEFAPSIPYPIIEKDEYIIFISGMSISSTTDITPFELLLQYLRGCLSNENMKIKPQNIMQMIIAGNSLLVNEEVFLNKHSKRDEKEQSIQPLLLLDTIVSEFAATLPTTIMPGKNDPTNFALPQQPINKCLLPKSSCFSTFNSSTNPAAFIINDSIHIYGNTGEMIDTMMDYTSYENPLDLMEKTLLFRHYMPSSPDTLGCFPFYDNDPFIVKEIPHIYFTSNQKKFQHKVISFNGSNVLLLSVPAFTESNTAVLVNLRNCECNTIQLGKC